VYKKLQKKLIIIKNEKILKIKTVDIPEIEYITHTLNGKTDVYMVKCFHKDNPLNNAIIIDKIIFEATFDIDNLSYTDARYVGFDKEKNRLFEIPRASNVSVHYKIKQPLGA